MIGPDGRILSLPRNPNEQLIFADLDLAQVTKAKTFADATGHCMLSMTNAPLCQLLTAHLDSRPDLMWLGVDEKHKLVVRPEGR